MRAEMREARRAEDRKEKRMGFMTMVVVARKRRGMGIGNQNSMGTYYISGPLRFASSCRLVKQSLNATLMPRKLYFLYRSRNRVVASLTGPT
jgi:hypothetical protein